MSTVISTHTIAAKAGHYIQAEDPKLVVDAILQVLDAARKHTNTWHKTGAAGQPS